MKEIINHAKQRGIAGLSLSVVPKNYALKLYQNIGFKQVGVVQDSWTMLNDFSTVV